MWSTAAALALTVTGCKAPDRRTSPAGAASLPVPSSSPSYPVAATPTRLAYGMMLSSGRWTGPRDQAGEPDLSIIDDILTEKAGYATPQYLRFTSAASSGSGVPADGSIELKAAHKLVAGGVQLGIAIDTYPKGTGRSIDSVLDQVKQIRAASEHAGHVYSWIFLDMAVHRTPAGGYGLNDLQQVVDGVIAAGWPKVIINATGFSPKNYQYLPQRTWGMAKAFGVMTAKNVQTAVGAVTADPALALQPGDIQFADYVNQHRQGSTAILKLEVPSQSQRFRTLSKADQTTLLQLWAQGGAQHDYRPIYPIFLPGVDPNGNQETMYDSVAAGTFWDQRALMLKFQ
jgi:hypothetical protein